MKMRYAALPLYQWFRISISIDNIFWFRGQPLGSEISHLHELCALIAQQQHSLLPRRLYPTENWLSSRCLASVIVRELVLPSWHPLLTDPGPLGINHFLFFYFFQKLWFQHTWPILEKEIRSQEVLAAVLEPVLFLVKECQPMEYEEIILPALR